MMKYLALVLSFIVFVPAAFAQQPSAEQLYRQINSVLAQENARLGGEKEQFQLSAQRATDELAKAKARIKELEAKQEEKK